MLKKLFLLSSIAAIGAFPAFAQDTTEPAPLPGQTQQPIEQPAIPQQPPSTGTIGEAAPAEPVMPPPAEAVIPAQSADELRADSLIGMSVYSTTGDKVGEVKDILFDESGQATGMVLSVGGVLGLGAKSVGLNWGEIDLRPEADMVKVQYSKEQLEAAPDFQTQEAQQAEAEAAAARLQQENPTAAGSSPPPAAPASTE